MLHVQFSTTEQVAGTLAGEGYLADRALATSVYLAAALAAAAELAAEGTSPPGDLNASPDYKRHLARVLCRRALEEAAA